MCRADNLTTFMCRLSGHLGASTSWNPQGLSKPVMGLLYLYLFLLFPEIKLKLKGRRFDTIEEIQAELQRVLDTLTEKDFQEAFQKWRRRWDQCLHAGGNYFEGDGG